MVRYWPGSHEEGQVWHFCNGFARACDRSAHGNDGQDEHRVGSSGSAFVRSARAGGGQTRRNDLDSAIVANRLAVMAGGRHYGAGK
jgi:hypothetical protein